MKIVFCGLTISSSWGNGHATTYRALVKALHRRGHQVDFVEKDVEWYRNHRDLPAPDFCALHLYEDWQQEEPSLLRLARNADAVILGSYFPDAIAAIEALSGCIRGAFLFYDIDTPVTLAGLREHGRVSYITPALIPVFDAYLSFSGGASLRELEQRLGAQSAVALYCSVDPSVYYPSPMREEYQCDLGYLGTFAQDRQPKLDELLCKPAVAMDDKQFIVAGPQYPPELHWPRNVKRIDHIAPDDHRFFYSASKFSLNVTRQDMVLAGHSPSVRIFEAAACGSAILCDRWAGLEEILTPGEEVLVPETAADVVEILRNTSDAERQRIGARARDRILGCHTAAHRAAQLEQILETCLSRAG